MSNPLEAKRSNIERLIKISHPEFSLELDRGLHLWIDLMEHADIKDFGRNPTVCVSPYSYFDAEDVDDMGELLKVPLAMLLFQSLTSALGLFTNIDGRISDYRRNFKEYNALCSNFADELEAVANDVRNLMLDVNTATKTDGEITDDE